ncbi:MAG: hypothetical protein A2147_07085 [Chloroflexi bacterium RBG_16_57_8]|nr:MAG: hypothetical protein A2147_07085 [Chloroflexi bacterium RBG_16_57_8]
MVMLVVALALASGSLMACAPGQERQEAQEVVAYLDKVSPFVTEYLERVNAVYEGNAAYVRVLETRDEYRLLEVLAAQSVAVDEALHATDSGISTLANSIPPSRAQLFHSLTKESMNAARDGLGEWDHAYAELYDWTYARFHPPMRYGEFPDVSKEMTQGRRLLRDALDTFKQAQDETDRMLEFVGQQVKT